MTSAANRLAARAIAALDDPSVLRYAVKWAREDTAHDTDDAPDAQDARSLVAVVEAAATAATSDDLDDHRAVITAVAALARGMLCHALDDPEA